MFMQKLAASFLPFLLNYGSSELIKKTFSETHGILNALGPAEIYSSPSTFIDDQVEKLTKVINK